MGGYRCDGPQKGIKNFNYFIVVVLTAIYFVAGTLESPPGATRLIAASVGYVKINWN